MSRRRFLLVCLQLIIVLVMSMIVEGMLTVDAPIESSRNPLQQLLYPPTKGNRPRENRNQRAYRLYHRCSERQVVIHDQVSTTGNITDTHGNLVLESMVKNDTLRIRIRGLTSKNYVCYNRRGRLIAKPREKAKGTKCEFTEEQVGGDFRYRSVYNGDWVLGFNQKGNPLSGPIRRREDCFKFLKTNSTLSGRSYEHLTRHQFNVFEHNRRIGRRQSVRIDTANDSNLFDTLPLHSMRHSKKSHRHRDRRPHFQRTSADR